MQPLSLSVPPLPSSTLLSFLFSHRGASGPLRRFTISNYNDYADLLRGELLFLLARCLGSGKGGQEEERGHEAGGTSVENQTRRIPPIRARILNPSRSAWSLRAARFRSPPVIYSKPSSPSCPGSLPFQSLSNPFPFPFLLHPSPVSSSILDISPVVLAFRSRRAS